MPNQTNDRCDHDNCDASPVWDPRAQAEVIKITCQRCFEVWYEEIETGQHYTGVAKKSEAR
jgi:hypothetical protein